MALAFKPVAAPQLVQGAALLAALAGLATWGTLLWTPTPQPVPAAMEQTLSAPPAAAGQWFANLPAQVDISLSGLLAGSAGAFGPAIHLVHEPRGPGGARVELWLSPGLDHLPVRIRVAEPGQPISDHWLETGAS